MVGRATGDRRFRGVDKDVRDYLDPTCQVRMHVHAMRSLGQAYGLDAVRVFGLRSVNMCMLYNRHNMVVLLLSDQPITYIIPYICYRISLPPFWGISACWEI